MSGQDSVKDFFDTGAYLKRNAIIPVRARIVREMLSTVERGRVLDLGCGDGSISRSMLELDNRLTLVDFSASMLESARGAFPPGTAVEFICANIADYTASEPYDAVICVGVLAHVPSVADCIARAAAALRPGGLCVLQTTDNAAPLGWMLNRYYRWRGREHYELNDIQLADLISTANHSGLLETSLRRYGVLLPGLGRLPYRWESGLEEAVGSRPKLSRIGAEVMVCFRKRGEWGLAGHSRMELSNRGSLR